MKSVQASLDMIRAVWGRGPSMHKEEPDLLRYEHIIDKVKPQVLVETGLYYGGSQIWFAARVPFVINIEANNQTTQDYFNNVHGLGEPPPNAMTFMGDSRKVYPAVESFIKQFHLGATVMVVLDSDHGTQTVYDELQLYSQLVTVGSYLVCEDGILGHMPKGNFKMGNWFEGSPLEALDKWLPGHPEFVPDMEVEDMFEATTNPSGWLKRVA